MFAEQREVRIANIPHPQLAIVAPCGEQPGLAGRPVYCPDRLPELLDHRNKAQEHWQPNDVHIMCGMMHEAIHDAS